MNSGDKVSVDDFLFKIGTNLVIVINLTRYYILPDLMQVLLTINLKVVKRDIVVFIEHADMFHVTQYRRKEQVG